MARQKVCLAKKFGNNVPNNILKISPYPREASRDMRVQTRQKSVFLGYFVIYAFLGKMFQTKVVLFKISDPTIYILCRLSLCVSLNRRRSWVYELKFVEYCSFFNGLMVFFDWYPYKTYIIIWCILPHHSGARIGGVTFYIFTRRARSCDGSYLHERDATTIELKRLLAKCLQDTGQPLSERGLT